MRILTSVFVWLALTSVALAQTDHVCVTSPSQTANYNQLCMSASSSGGSLALTNQGTATGGLALSQNGSILGGRIRLTTSLTLHSDTGSGTDQAGCGLATGTSACRTLNYLLNNVFIPNYDTAGHAVTLSFVANDSTCVSIGTGWTGGGQVTIQGPGGSPPSIGLTCSEIAIGINAPLPAALFIQGFKISGGTIGVFSQAPGFIVANNINYGAESLYHIQLSGPGAKYLCNGNYTISGNSGYHWYTSSTGALIQCSAITLTLSGTPVFNIFAVAIDGGAIQPTLNTYSGSATGARFAVGSQGLIDTGTGNVNLLPGNSAGVVGAGGYYN